MMAALYPNKKALKAAKGSRLKYRETSLFGTEYRSTGVLTVVGPSEYERKWFANVTMENDLIKGVS